MLSLLECLLLPLLIAAAASLILLNWIEVGLLTHYCKLVRVLNHSQVIVMRNWLSWCVWLRKWALVQVSTNFFLAELLPCYYC